MYLVSTANSQRATSLERRQGEGAAAGVCYCHCHTRCWLSKVPIESGLGRCREGVSAADGVRNAPLPFSLPWVAASQQCSSSRLPSSPRPLASQPILCCPLYPAGYLMKYLQSTKPPQQPWNPCVYRERFIFFLPTDHSHRASQEHFLAASMSPYPVFRRVLVLPSFLPT